MKKGTVKIIIVLFVLGIVFNTPFFAYSKTGDEVNQEVKSLNKEIQAKKEQMEKIQEQQEIYSKAIKQKQGEQASLGNQLAILENRLAKAELDIVSVETEMDRVDLEIQKTNLSITEKSEAIEKEREHIGNVLKIMYKQNRVTTLEAVLLNESLTDFLNEMRYLEDINKEIANSLDSLKETKNKLEEDKLALNENNKELLNLKEELENKKSILEDEQGSRTFVLDQTRNSEREYQRLLAKAKQEQEAAAADVVSLEKAVRAKMMSLNGKEIEFNDNGLIWPVPKNVITSTFHDPDYPFRYIFEHPAIDIRAGQGTILKAAASGYVARTKLNGTNYGYIMIVHGDGLSTVYGHISKVYVEEDEYVVQGQAIGASGGMPGTPGAGRLTTGPHLHFEVRLNGIPVNPSEYLP